jgi:pyruvate/2-oxoglutarate dehydrogenase complex dihydrolipoamide acyltransferase (E2) component
VSGGRPPLHDALSVSFYHRVADGLDSERFGDHVTERLEYLYRLLL